MSLDKKTAQVVFVVLLVAGALLLGQKLPSGPQVLSFLSDVDDTDQPYGLYLPKDFDAAKKYPLVIMLHGAGSNHRLDLKRVFGKGNLPGETDAEASRYFPTWPDVDYIVATPLARGTMGYQNFAEKDVLDVLADLKKRFPIDENRTYLTGLSMGGGGTLWLGLTRPDIWAAIAPVCPAFPFGTSELAPNALNVPVHFFQGGADPLVNPEGTRQWARRLQDLGTTVEYTEYPGVGHNAWDNAYRDEAIFEWFGRFKRNPFPDHVRFTSSAYRYASAYWVQLDQLTPGTYASIDAQFTAPNHIEIKTSAVGAFTLRLPGHPRFAAARPVEMVVDGKTLTASSGTAAPSVTRVDGSWTLSRYDASSSGKRAGAEGPLAEAFDGRHIYVYGTAGNPLPQELAARREAAATAANWSGGAGLLGGSVLFFPQVVSDRALRPNDMKIANLVLFGTKSSNTVIAQLADRLPMQLDDAASGYGLLYVVPIDGHDVLVSSGLPWWPPSAPAAVPVAGPARANAGRNGGAGRAAAPGGRSSAQASPPPAGYDMLGGRAASYLMPLQDYVLFRGSLNDIVVQGRFDDNWRLSASDAGKLKATGVVVLRNGQAATNSEQFRKIPFVIDAVGAKSAVTPAPIREGYEAAKFAGARCDVCRRHLWRSNGRPAARPTTGCDLSASSGLCRGRRDRHRQPGELRPGPHT
jgi:predicted esterase